MRALLLLLLLTACAGAPEGSCALHQAGALALRPVGNVPLATVYVNGLPSELILGVGSDATLLGRDAARRLNLSWNGKASLQIEGAGGRARADLAVLPTLVLGGATLRWVPVIIGQGFRAPVDGLLGMDALAGFEVDLDMPHKVATLYRARTRACAAAVPAWTHAYTRLAVRQGRGRHLYVPAEVDGHPLLGLLVTGSSRTVVQRRAVAGIDGPGQAPMDGPASRMQTMDSLGLLVHSRRFRALQVGSDVIENPLLNIADLPAESGDLVIGADYLGTRRVWIALATGSVFVSTRE